MTQDHMNEEKHTMGEIVRTLERIESQVKKTNGRVNNLERWRWVVTGATVALGLMSAPNLAVIAKVLAGI